MKDRIFITALIVLVLVSGGYLYKKEKAQEAGKNKSALSIMGKAETFEGTLPCADCEGIKTVIIFTLNKEKTGGTYVEKSTYLGAPTPSSFEEKGTLKIVKGRSNNPDAIIYVLSTKPDEVQAYELVDSDHLRLLDQEMQPITETNLNFTLTKQPAR